MLNLLYILVGALFGLLVAETVLLITVYKFLKSYDVHMFSDDWYPVRIRKFPFTVR